ncbi:hypothetical protein AMAG_17941 [Allomyces macrogynus ATCC 38327]|uniref:Uncharacterized protein n=1 Tax=Allomyces macrogynus (strain ATCC 38327) TaxID=578462 RepID=A0A0L0S227_ALLM3|nr:hypothetical protein, variant [Allomyces macrogynus ATCC 38327]KNE56599.1 hypothetical protein AMAG_17941 [Allomyces macrogynus ATCC 38327]|eukprot:KNE56598.1 hypothetical protein, variant [Allomyces macrogynus ATCC 38327]
MGVTRAISRLWRVRALYEQAVRAGRAETSCDSLSLASAGGPSTARFCMCSVGQIAPAISVQRVVQRLWVCLKFDDDSRLGLGTTSRPWPANERSQLDPWEPGEPTPARPTACQRFEKDSWVRCDHRNGDDLPLPPRHNAWQSTRAHGKPSRIGPPARPTTESSSCYASIRMNSACA